MNEFLRNLFRSDFMPHGHCMFWQPELIWLHAISDGLIALAYYSIPITLILIVLLRKNLGYRLIFIMFGAFIVACGTTHVMNVITLWEPIYRAEGIVKAATAAVSVLTAGLLWRVLPRALELHPWEQLHLSNQKLRKEIDERRAAEARLRDANRFLDSVIENIPDMVFVKDAEELRFVRFNKAGEELLGYSREELIGKSDYDFFPRDEADAFTREDRRVLETGELVETPEESIHTRNKGVRLLNTKKIPIFDESGRPQFLLGISRDITDRKRTEEELKKYRDRLEDLVSVRTRELEDTNQKLRREIAERKRVEEEVRRLNEELELRVHRRTAQRDVAHEELENFTYTVSHDLRAPLRHMSGFLDLLKQELARENPSDKIQRYLNNLDDSTRRMNGLIDNLLEFSRTGRVELVMEESHLGALVKEIISDFNRSTAGRTVIWKTHDLPELSADPRLIRLVLVDLISNALKFTRTRDRAVIEIGMEEDEDEVFTFFVKDNGVGFDMKYSKKLFDVFQRLHRADEFEGTGIGLANVRRIIQRHRGRVWAEAAVNEGATFYFTLPRAPQASPKETSA